MEADQSARVRGAEIVASEDVPDAHVRAGNLGELDGSGETLVPLGIVVLEADLQLDGLEEVPLLLIEGVVKQLLDVRANSGCCGAKSIVSQPVPEIVDFDFGAVCPGATYRL